MINIKDKKECCGCEACAQVCPKRCISLVRDGEGFRYPSVDLAACVNCRLCEEVCPALHPHAANRPEHVIAAINRNDRIREQSSSGGVFFLLAERIINNGGVVFGAKFDDKWQAVIESAETLDEVRPMMGSKYFQARLDGSYIKCKQYLDSGREVLFTGTPCHIAGLNHYLGKSYPNLLTCDIICHGAPSPKVWELYLDEAVTAGRQAITDVQFRNKRLGWKKFCFSLSYNESDKTYTMSSPHDKNPYMRAFLKNVILRPSCHSCPAKGGKSGSDITIADFWGVKSIFPNMDDDGGTSLIMTHTPKGYAALPLDKMQTREATYNDVLRSNPAVEKSVQPHHRREEFFAHLDMAKDLQQLIAQCLRPTSKEMLRSVIGFPFRAARRIAKIRINGKNKKWGG